MDRYGYILKPNKGPQTPSTRYHKTDLELMTTFQLREICTKEKIIQGIINPMDKDELIYTILYYRGADEYFLIQRQDGVGRKAIEEALRRCRLQFRPAGFLHCRSKITAYQGLAIGYKDGYTLPYDKRFAGSNAFLVSGDGMLCAILNLLPKGDRTDVLYLTKAAEITCLESDVKNYSLYCLERRESELFYKLHEGKANFLLEQLPVYSVPLLDFEIRQPVSLPVPIAIDFGTTNTTAGVFLDYRYFEQTGHPYNKQESPANTIHYAAFYNTAANWEETPLFPSVVGIHSLNNGKPRFLFGYEAIRLANSSYIDEGFCVFYDIKRWVSDYEKKEEITDRQGHRQLIKRKDILKAYFIYVLNTVANQYKCKIEKVHITCPVKQKTQFMRLFDEILPGYAVGAEDMIDEGVAVLYNAISQMITDNQFEDGTEYKALILDCGGGTTDLCSGSFRIEDKKPSFWVDIETAYENGDTDFGGNNLTYRTMQLLKIAIVNRMGLGKLIPVRQLLARFDVDVYRGVDKSKLSIYQELETVYQEAERYLPTRYKEYENQSRKEYYKVKNNFYFLFQLAETIKKEFYSQTGLLQVGIGECGEAKGRAKWIEPDKWKLSVMGRNGLETIKSFPSVTFSIFDLELLLQADIYSIVKRFLEDMYRRGMLEDYSMIRLTGQSCKMQLFRDAIKEFVPGRTIQTSQGRRGGRSDNSFKMNCVDGAIKYLRDKKLGLTHISIRAKEPALPYQISAYTHQGKEVVLIERFARSGRGGMISRNVEDLTLELYLKNADGNLRYRYLCSSYLSDFEEMKYEQISAQYGTHIPQGDTDDIEDFEVRFFLWTRPLEWSFSVVPIYRKQRRLYLGKETIFSFENEQWVQNFFDGMK